MILWDSRKLIERLKEGPLTERESFGYLLLWFSWGLLNELPSKGTSFDHGRGTWPVFTVMSVSVLLPLVVCYRLNGKVVGGRFLERYLALSFPALLRAFAAWLSFSAIYSGVVYLLLKRQFPVVPGTALQARMPLIAELTADILSVFNQGFFMANVLYYLLFALLIISYFKRLSEIPGGHDGLS